MILESGLLFWITLLNDVSGLFVYDDDTG